MKQSRIKDKELIGVTQVGPAGLNAYMLYGNKKVDWDEAFVSESNFRQMLIYLKAKYMMPVLRR